MPARGERSVRAIARVSTPRVARPRCPGVTEAVPGTSAPWRAEGYAPFMARWLLAVSCGLAFGCASAHREPQAAPDASRSPPPWALVYVLGSDGTLERRDDTTLGWSAACSGRCGEYVPAARTYRLRGAAATSAPFSLPPPDLGRVVLRFDGDGRVWTHGTPRGLRQPQPFVPSFVMLWR
jgi:hypothetical protein